LAVPSRLSSSPRLDIIAAQEVERVCRFQSCGPIGAAFSIHQQRKLYPSFLSESAGIIHVTEADGSQGGPCALELVLVLAQLRDVLTAEDSAVMPQEDNHRGMVLPRRAEANVTAAGFRQDEARKLVG
jgi:hypothetical protein